MSSANSLQEHFWFHRCGICSNCFSTAKLAEPCPKCKDDINRDTISYNVYLHECYGEMTPEEWSTTLAIEDLTNPVDATEEVEQPTTDPLYNKILDHLGHKIEAVTYGRAGKKPANAAVECIDCGVVLVDADCCDG